MIGTRSKRTSCAVRIELALYPQKENQLRPLMQLTGALPERPFLPGFACPIEDFTSGDPVVDQKSRKRKQKCADARGHEC